MTNSTSSSTTCRPSRSKGPKGVGKTRTALQRAKTVHRLDDPAELAGARADPARLLVSEGPVLIDEWQRLPQVWDLVRRAVDDGAAPGRFLPSECAGSPCMNGSGQRRSVSLICSRRAAFGHGHHGRRAGRLRRRDPGFRSSRRAATFGPRSPPSTGGLRGANRRSRHPRRCRSGHPQSCRAAAVDGRLRRGFFHDRHVPDHPRRRERRQRAQASRNATRAYRDALTRVWALDEVQTWIPSNNRLSELGQTPKRGWSAPDHAGRRRRLGGLNRAIVETSAADFVA